jgi:putative oxidoreductase
MNHLKDILNRRSARASRWLARYSISLLRISLGLVFLGFGVLKFFPGVSPAENLASETMDALTLGLIPDDVRPVLVASLETVIGLLLVSGRYLRLGVALLGVAMVGILAPLVLFPDRLFAGPSNAPTLEGQYVLKDVVLLAAGLVVAAGALGGRIVAERDEAAPGGHGAELPALADRARQRPAERAAA